MIFPDNTLFFYENREVVRERSPGGIISLFTEKPEDKEVGEGVRKRRRIKLKIDSGMIGMESSRSYRAMGASVRRFAVRDSRQSLGNNTFFGNALTGTMVGGGQEEEKEDAAQVKDRENVNSAPEDWQKRFGIRGGNLETRARNGGVQENLRQLTLRYIFDMLFAARRGRFSQWMEENGYQEQTSSQTQSFQNWQIQPVSLSREESLSLRQESWFAEQESTGFSTVGTVRTSDGREIHFNVDVAMSRSFEQRFSQEVKQTNYKMCDPLVINMDVGSAELRDQKFFFDLDADGQEEEISMLGSGSGYLALDKNGDGKINDGSELFGTSSGDGFSDLARYDQDGNGWIDENDEIWSKLQIWTKDENGQDKLYKLSEKGVGAIYLGSASTDFSLVGADGYTNGMIRKTGIFLYENGAAGTVQHLDVAKYQKEA